MRLDWTFFADDPGGQFSTYWAWLLSAWGWTLTVSVLSFVVALIVGGVIGTLRTIPGRPTVVRLCDAYVEMFRDIPLLVQVFLWYHVAPAFVPPLKLVPSAAPVIVALGLFTSARIAEQLRAGIQALPRGQRDAGKALGFTTFQTYCYVILPMAVRLIIPPLTSESMNIVKNSSVAFAVSIPELTMYAMQVQEETSRGIEVYLAVTALYALSAFSINRLMTMVEQRLRLPGFAPSRQLGGH
ncbi:amino acid ABC transporter permease [Pandoraea anhela]|uniref:Amino acid ABC transporter permease n=1 Tax=Pandoraea anhela TaxID=2508295 RepID=A0A5E4RAF5_9BURK|nr:amino acid ABC transporter permease [Pandoraea anhela]VVD59019.1 amino acid ABC transporter permease [Pandoraea anhela]